MTGSEDGNVPKMGKYRLLSELGRGGMGVVYLAEDTRLCRRVALKVLHPALMLDSGFVKGFVSEAQAIASMTHPGIVRVHAFEEIEGKNLIDMEYVDGKSLDKIIARGSLNTEEALGIVVHILEALAACHLRGMVHRDIKPANILVAYDGRVLLSDFGLAMSVGLASVSAASSSCFIGTPKYAPPESWDKATPSPAGDVYSAGLVLLELLAGETPFDGDSPLEIMRKIVDPAPIPVRELLPDISEELAALLTAMLDAEPRYRPADAGAALERLRETEEAVDLPEDGAETLRITPPKIPHRLVRIARRTNRWPVLTVPVIFLVLAGLLWFVPSPGPDDLESTVEAGQAAPPPDVTPPVSPDVDRLAVVGKHLVFTAFAGDWRTLWSFDTTTGTVVPIWPELALGPEDTVFEDGGQPAQAAIVGVLRTQTDGMRLFRTDGTPAGTYVLAYAPSIQANRMELLEAREGTVWFSRIAGDNTFGLWYTDGTIEGTRHRWGDVSAPIVTGVRTTPLGAQYFASHTDGSLYYWPKNAPEPHSLWPELSATSYMGEFINVGERVLAEAGDRSNGRELWAGGPEAQSLHLIKEFVAGPHNGLNGPQFTSFRDGVVLAANTPELGRELWFTDGTAAGTRLISDINRGPMDSSPYRFNESGGLLYFSALTAENGQELWVTDGMTAGTHMVTDVRPGVASSNPYAFCPFKDGLLFTADDGVHGEELWFSDGTAEGTRLVRDCMPGQEQGAAHGTLLIGERAYFGADHPTFGRVLWESDGTPEGTKPCFEALAAQRAPQPGTSPWAYLGDRIIIVNTTADYGSELWVTDPEKVTSTLLRDIYPGPKGRTPHAFQVFDDHLYVAANDGIHGTELWRSDGTRDGTALVYDAYTGSESGAPRELTHWGDGRLAFTARIDRSNNIQGNAILYIDKGTDQPQIAGGTTGRGPHWIPKDLTDGGEWLLFSTQSSDGQTILWRTNGSHTEALPAHGLGEAP